MRGNLKTVVLMLGIILLSTSSCNDNSQVIQKMIDKVTAMQQTIDKLRQELHEQQLVKDQLRREKEELREQIDRRDTLLRSFQQEVLNLNEKLQETEQLVENLTRDKEELFHRVDELNSQVIRLDSLRNLTLGENKKLQEYNEQLLRQVKTLREQQKEYPDQLGELRTMKITTLSLGTAIFIYLAISGLLKARGKKH